MRSKPYRSRFQLGHFPAREIVRAAVFVLAVAGVFASAAAAFLGVPGFDLVPAWARAVFYGVALGGAGCIAYGVLIEPYRVIISTVRLISSKLRRPVRLVHLSDLHVRGWSSVEEQVLARVGELKPDAILLTGDYTSSNCEHAALSRLLKGLCAVAPVYGTCGNKEFSSAPVRRVPQDAGVRWLSGESVKLQAGGGEIVLYGIDAGDEARVFKPAEAVSGDVYSICLYHYPDFVPELERVPYDLMLCGHTHGGQVRLPWIGAVISSSRAGTRYARGLFRDGSKAAYVTQGVGCESHGMPRVRFLCPPEIVLITLSPGRKTA